MNSAVERHPPETQTIQVNGLSFFVETRGNPEGEPVLFIMGLGAQMTLWPEALLNAYADAGYRVIRFDNRDIGLSSQVKARLNGHPLAAMARYRLGLPLAAPYTLHDMARDACGILDGLDITRAHIVGVSMGGMISQILAGVKLAGVGAKGHDEEAVVNRSLAFWKTIQGTVHPTPLQEVQERLRSDFRRSYHPAGILRQTRAILATGSLSSITRRIRVPTTIIHGTADPLVRPGAAKQLQYLVPHARLQLISGMGHDLPEPVLHEIAKSGLAMMASV